MFIKMKTSIAGGNFSYQPGQEVEVSTRIAKKWIKAGFAEEIPDDKSTSIKLSETQKELDRALAIIEKCKGALLDMGVDSEKVIEMTGGTLPQIQGAPKPGDQDAAKTQEPPKTDNDQNTDGDQVAMDLLVSETPKKHG